MIHKLPYFYSIPASLSTGKSGTIFVHPEKSEFRPVLCFYYNAPFAKNCLIKQLKRLKKRSEIDGNIASDACIQDGFYTQSLT